MVFLRKRITKHSAEPACTTRTFQGDVWQEAQAVLGVEERWDLFADASAIAHAERARMRITEGLANTPTPVCITCLGGEVVHGWVREAGTDFIGVQENDTTYAVLRLQSVLRIEGVADALRVEGESETAPAQLNLVGWLRAQTHEVLQCHMIDSWSMQGRLREVGEDFIRIQGDGQRVTSVMTQQISVIRVTKRFSNDLS